MTHKTKNLNLGLSFIKKNFAIFIIISVFLFINFFTLKNWFFSAIGDEYAHFNYAKTISQRKNKPNIFSQKGVYDVIPTLSSYYQATIMQLLGTNILGWKGSHVLLTAVTILIFYFLVKKLFNTSIAIIISSIFSSNHVIWAYIHTGYSQIEALFPFVASLAAFTYNKFFLSGILTALGFYTYYTSRITFLIILVWFFIIRKSINLKHALFRFFLGFGILMTPFLIVNKTDIIKSMLERSLISQNDPTAYGPWYIFMFDNFIRNGISPWHNQHTMHYVSGSVVDQITGILLLIGIIFLLKNIKTSLAIKVLTIYLIPFIIVASFSPYSYTVISRVHILIPAYSIIAGYGIFQLSKLIKKRLFRNILFCASCVLILLLNMYRFYIQTPKVIDSTDEALSIKALTTTCKNSLYPIVLGKSIEPLLTPALDAYNIKAILVEYSTENLPKLRNSDCLIFMRLKDNEINNYLKQANITGYKYYEISDYYGHKKTVLLKK